MSNYKIIDTNVLEDFPHVLDEENIIIPTIVLKELDGLKMNQNPEVAFKARRAAILISKRMKDLEFDTSAEQFGLSVDDSLIELAKSYAGELITNDVYLKIKAFANNVRTSGYGNSEDYIGAIYWKIDINNENDQHDLEIAFEEHKVPERFSLRENQFLIVDDGHGKEFIFWYRGGELQIVNPKAIRNKWIDKITPKNSEQICLFNMLADRDLTIIYAGGKFGSGKSFILNNFALQELEQQQINKIVYVPNNSYVRDTMELGALPGTSIEKVTPMLGSLIDLIGIDFVDKLISQDKLEVVPMSYIRGRSFENSIIIVNEAQNLTEDHIKLLLGRCGTNTRIFWDGDQRQTDSSVFKNKNGLRLLLKLSESETFSKLFGTIRLEKTERSQTARAADYLDKLTGGV